MKPSRDVGEGWSRRAVVRALGVGVVCAPMLGVLSACQRALPGNGGGGGGGDASAVTVYCSLDRDIVEPVLAAAGKALSVRVDAVYDTEATKTTGLALRLRSEVARPRADLWLSSEAINTATLAAEGVLDPIRAEGEAMGAVLSRWPAAHRAPMWVQLALRARVLVHNSKAVERSGVVPTGSLLDFVDERLKGRAAIADPRFGTTRGQLALLHRVLSPDGFDVFVRALKMNGVQISPGNAAVVRAVARGEAHAGITDIDDLRAAEREGWPVVESVAGDASVRVEMMERARAGALKALSAADVRAIDEASCISTPTTLAFVRSSPNPRGAEKLAAWLLDTNLETALSVPSWGAVAVDPKVRVPDGSGSTAAKTLEPDWSALKDHINPALTAWQQIMG